MPKETNLTLFNPKVCDIDEVDTPGKEDTDISLAAGEEENDGPPLPPRTPAPQVRMEIRMVIVIITIPYYHHRHLHLSLWHGSAIKQYSNLIQKGNSISAGNVGKCNPHLFESRGEKGHGNTSLQRRTHGGLHWSNFFYRFGPPPQKPHFLELRLRKCLVQTCLTLSSSD